MFHAKILWFYHANPHLHAPLEYTGDLWLRFMRWVHTPSAYGPVFTAIESPAYLLGLGKFVPVLYLMKATMVSFFVWCVYLIGKIGTILKFDRKKIVYSQIIIAFNPFLLLDLVINSHNDAVMVGIFLFAFYLHLKNKNKLSLVSLAASIGVKFVTALTLPVYFFRDPKIKILLASFALFLPVALTPGRFQPWYLTWSLIPASLIGKMWSKIWIMLASVAGLAYYYPYVRTGFWVDSTNFKMLIIYIPVLLTFLLSVILSKRARLTS
jgi:hypothetical protein